MPSLADYDSEMEYQDALSAYEAAEDRRIDECREDYYDRKFN
jgi:hypothetical protein